jgi:nucleoside-diphosphate-sugar epimerase
VGHWNGTLGELVNSKKIGILGATGLIARELIGELVFLGYDVTKFSRTKASGIGLHPYEQLLKHDDLGAIVNLVGGHSKNPENAKLEQVLAIDELACEWSQTFGRPYVYISSGAVFGKGHLGPVSVDTLFGLETTMDHYTQGKLKAERRHSALRNNGIRVSDLRMFSYAGPSFIQEGRYFLSSVLKAAVGKNIFYASGSEFVRDYIGANELSSAILNILKLEVGIKFNLFSDQAATRMEILEFFQQRFGLSFVSNPEDGIEFYCSQISNLLPDYKPRKSLDVISGSILPAKTHE